MSRVVMLMLVMASMVMAAPVPGAKTPTANSPSTAPAVKPPTADEIRQAIEDLGSKRFVVRDRAKKFLFEAGSAAEQALSEAAKSTDEEIASAAKSILERFEWGLYPNTPDKTRELIERFRTGTPDERQQAVGELLQQRNLPLSTLRKLLDKEDNPEFRAQMLLRLHQQVRETLPGILARGEFDAAEALFELIVQGQPKTIGEDYATFMLLRGKLDPAIARFEKQRTAKGDEGKRAEAMLTYLYRVKGDWAKARKAATAAGDEELVDRVLWRSFDWKALAEAGRPPEFGPYVQVGAAYDRLAGNQKASDEKLARLKQEAEEQQEDWNKLRMDTNALFLNGRANEAITVLVDKKRQMAFTFDLLCSQMRHKEAFELVDDARRKDTDENERQEIEIRRARMLALLGDRDSALQIFKGIAEKMKAPEHGVIARSLVKTEARADMMDNAAEHAAKMMHIYWEAGQRGGYGALLEPIFGDNKDAAAAWWSLFRMEKPNEEPTLAMNRVRAVIDGKLDRKELDEWLPKLEKKAKEQEPDARGERRLRVSEQSWLQAMAAAYRGIKDDEKTLAALKRAAEAGRNMEGWIAFGDFLMDRKQYRDAVEAFDKAAQVGRKSDLIELDIDDDNAFEVFQQGSPALPMYLKARALMLAGDKEESKRLAEMAHWVPLGNEVVRAGLVENLNKRGWIEMAKKEADFLMKTGWYSHYSYGNVLSFLARNAAREKDYFTAADCYEKCLVGCLRTGANFIEPTAYLLVPESVRVYRARGLVAAGKIDEALKEAEANLAVMPGNVDIAIRLVPELEKQGKKKEADAMYEKVREKWVELSKAHPESAFAHNSAAWLMANCQRELDAALKHSLKATALEPKNSGYLDTLAEVYFRKGDREKALTLMKQCIELNPKHDYFRKQLVRFKDQPFTSPTPDEGEDE